MKPRRDARWTFVWGAAAFVLELGLADAVRLGPAWPDLAFAYVAAVALLSGARHGLLAGAGLGLMVDLYSAHWLGLHALAYGAAGWGLGRLVAPFDEQNRAVAFLAAGLGGLFAASVQAVVVAVLAGGLDVRALVFAALPSVLFTALFVALVAPWDLGLPRRTETEGRELRELKLWF